MTAFETFVNTELPQRCVVIKGATEATGDPRESTVPKVLGAPIGTRYFRDDVKEIFNRFGPNSTDWIREGSSANAMWGCPSNITITVDPVNGDDSEGNDGTVIPLKTLNVLFERLPAKVSNLQVLLKAGTHDWSIDNWGSYYTIPGGTYFFGEWAPEVGSDWTVTNVDEVVLSKDPLTTPWVVNEHSGKFLVVYSYGVEYPSVPIASNTEHTITINATAWTGCGYEVGDTVRFGNLTTEITSSEDIWNTFTNLGIQSSFEYIHFNLATGPAIEGGSFYFGRCKFSNCSYQAIGAWDISKIEIGYCYFENCGSGTIFFSDYSTYGGIGACIFVNSNLCVRATIEATLQLNAHMSANVIINTACLAYITYGARCIMGGNAGETWFHATNCNYLISAYTASRIEHSGSFTVSMRNSTRFLTSVVYLAHASTKLQIGSGWAAEATTAANTFRTPYGYFSLSDLRNKYNKFIYLPLETQICQK